VKLSLLNLPVPVVTLPPWTPDTSARWDAHAEGARSLGRGAGVGRNFAALLAEARALLAAGDLAALVERCGRPRFLRAVVTSWRDDADLARATMTPDLVRNLGTNAGCSRLTAITAVSLLLEHFDLLDHWRPGLFVATRDLVWRAVSTQAARGQDDLIAAVRVHARVLLEADGPLRLAEWLTANGVDFTTWLRNAHLSEHADGRFGRLTRDAFYLTWIGAADAERADHDLLRTISSEVVARQRTESSRSDGRWFGHDVLTALTAKATRYPSDAWLTAVQAIGGDPRTRETAQWRLWWSQVPPAHVARAVRWLQGVDLKAFLDGVARYAADTGNDDMTRMLDRRRRLLLGLYEQDRVDDVRLVLGDDIRAWIRRATPGGVDAARLSDTAKQDTALVYVDCGDFALVEGSHNFKLHIFTGGPVPELADRRVREFRSGDIRESFPARHQKRYGYDSYLGVAHQGGEWIRRSLDFLHDRGVRLDERVLMTPIDYADLARRRATGWY
jgi:hypothetical protein